MRWKGNKKLKSPDFPIFTSSYRPDIRCLPAVGAGKRKLNANLRTETLPWIQTTAAAAGAATFRFSARPPFFITLPPQPSTLAHPYLPASQRVSAAESAPARMKMPPRGLCHTRILYPPRRGRRRRLLPVAGPPPSLSRISRVGEGSFPL